MRRQASRKEGMRKDTRQIPGKSVPTFIAPYLSPSSTEISSTIHTLDLEGNSIGDDGVQALSEALKVNTTIQTLNFKSNQISAKGIKFLSDTLKVNTTLHTLNISDNKIGYIGMQALSEALKVNTTLHTLNLHQNEIGDRGILSLREAMKVNASLRTLNLGNNKITIHGIKVLSEILRMNTSLQLIDFHMNHIGDDGVKIICESLKVNQKLHTLSLSSNQITEVGAKALSDLLMVNSTIHTLLLGDNYLGDAGIEALCKVLNINTSIQSVNFSTNNIGYAGAKILSDFLKTNSRLHTINLSNNSFTDEGNQLIVDMLKSNTTIHTIRLGGNKFQIQCIQTLAEVLKLKKSIQILHIENNNIGESGAISLSDALKSNSTLFTLNLAENSIGENGIHALSEALKANSTLQILNLSDNKIGTSGAQHLGEALKVNNTIHTLDLGKNKIGSSGIQALSDALNMNSMIHTLNLTCNIKPKLQDQILKQLSKNKTIFSLRIDNDLLRREVLHQRSQMEVIHANVLAQTQRNMQNRNDAQISRSLEHVNQDNAVKERNEDMVLGEKIPQHLTRAKLQSSSQDDNEVSENAPNTSDNLMEKKKIRILMESICNLNGEEEFAQRFDKFRLDYNNWCKKKNMQSPSNNQTNVSRQFDHQSSSHTHVPSVQITKQTSYQVTSNITQAADHFKELLAQFKNEFGCDVKHLIEACKDPEYKEARKIFPWLEDLGNMCKMIEEFSQWDEKRRTAEVVLNNIHALCEKRRHCKIDMRRMDLHLQLGKLDQKLTQEQEMKIIEAIVSKTDQIKKLAQVIEEQFLELVQLEQNDILEEAKKIILSIESNV